MIEIPGKLARRPRRGLHRRFAFRRGLAARFAFGLAIIPFEDLDDLVAWNDEDRVTHVHGHLVFLLGQNLARDRRFIFQLDYVARRQLRGAEHRNRCEKPN